MKRVRPTTEARRDVVGTPIMRTWHIAHQTEKRHSPVAKAMRDFMLEHGGEFLRPEFAPIREKPAKTRAPSLAKRAKPA